MKISAPTDMEYQDDICECHFEEKCSEFDCENCKLGSETMKGEYIEKSNLLNAAIENEFGPLYWADITLYGDGETGSITFTGPSISEREWKPGAFRGAEDAFFAKMRRIKDMIKNCGFSASLTRFEADCDCPYSEARIDINFAGAELEQTVECLGAGYLP